MESKYYISIVLLSFLMTYPIRSIPALFISKLELSPYWQKFLDLVPYTALTALVFPGVFYCIDNNQYAAYIGTAVALVAAIAKMSLSIVVLVAVAAAYIAIIAVQLPKIIKKKGLFFQKKTDLFYFCFQE